MIIIANMIRYFLNKAAMQARQAKQANTRHVQCRLMNIGCAVCLGELTESRFRAQARPGLCALTPAAALGGVSGKSRLERVEGVVIQHHAPVGGVQDDHRVDDDGVRRITGMHMLS